MSAKEITLIDRQRKTLGSITWTPDGRLTATIREDNPALATEIENLLKEVIEQGVQWHFGEHLEHKTPKIIAEKVEIVNGRDQRFPNALADRINQTVFSGNRVFALVKNLDSELKEEQ